MFRNVRYPRCTFCSFTHFARTGGKTVGILHIPHIGVIPPFPHIGVIPAPSCSAEVTFLPEPPQPALKPGSPPVSIPRMCKTAKRCKTVTFCTFCSFCLFMTFTGLRRQEGLFCTVLTTFNLIPGVKTCVFQASVLLINLRPYAPGSLFCSKPGNTRN